MVQANVLYHERSAHRYADRERRANNGLYWYVCAVGKILMAGDINKLHR